MNTQATPREMKDAIWFARAFVAHWIKDVQGNVTPTLGSLEEVLSRLDAVYSKANGGQ